MIKRIIEFKASAQSLQKTGGIHSYASDTVSYVEATFVHDWEGFDSIKAVWKDEHGTKKTSIINSEGKCVVPHEVLANVGRVFVNLVGIVSENNELIERLTTFPVKALDVTAKAETEGDETVPITPSQFDQFAEAVRHDADRAEQAADDSREQADRAETEANRATTEADRAEDEADNALASAQNAHASELRAGGYASDAQQSAESAQGYAQNASESATEAETAKDEAEDARDLILGMRAVATILPEGSEPTARFENGVLYLGIPKGDTGEKGDKGNTGDAAGFGTVTATIDANVGTPSVEVTASGADTAKNFSFAFHNMKGDTGATGNGIASIALKSTSGAVKTYTITMTNGTTFDFDVTDGEVTNEQISELLPTDTASGSIASFPDGQSVIPALSVKAEIEPIQDLNGYDKPWVGGAGKNLLDSDYAIKFTLNKTITLPKTISANSRIHLHSDSYSYTTPPSSGLKYPYYVFRDADGNNCGAVWAYRDGWLTLSADAVVVQLWSNGYDYAASTGVEVTINGLTISLEEQSSWTPYSNICPISGHTEVDVVVSPTTDAEDGNTYTTALGRTVYGGTLDMVSGVLTVDRVAVDMGNLVWVSNGTIAGGNQWGTWSLTDKAYGDLNLICSAFETHTAFQDIGVIFGRASTAFVIVNSSITDLDQFKASVTGQTICYELATPQTYQLTPTEIALLKGQNNVWTDSGEVEVTYKADVEKWVNKKINALI